MNIRTLVGFKEIDVFTTDAIGLSQSPHILPPSPTFFNFAVALLFTLRPTLTGQSPPGTYQS